MNSHRNLILLLLALAFATPAFAADLVSVKTSVTQFAVQRGGSNEGTIEIQNVTNADVRVALSVKVVYADGTVQPLTGITDPGVVPPAGGEVLRIHFIIPPDAAFGNASFVADVSASSSGGLQEKETSSAGFVVLGI